MLMLITSIVAATIKELFLFFGYIQNVNSFPQPLSAQEEQQYLEEYRKGSEDAKNILVERNLRLVAHIVKKYTNTGREVDDLISIGTIGLIKAIITFDEDKGTRLATYAARCIEKGILTKMLQIAAASQNQSSGLTPFAKISTVPSFQTTPSNIDNTKLRRI